MSTPEHLTPEQVADTFKVSRRTVIRYAGSGRWPHTRIGKQVRFTPEDVEAIHVLQRRDAAPVDEQPADPWGRVTRQAS